MFVKECGDAPTHSIAKLGAKMMWLEFDIQGAKRKWVGTYISVALLLH